MKKIFTLLMALSLVAGINARPVALGQPKGKVFDTKIQVESRNVPQRLAVNPARKQALANQELTITTDSAVAFFYGRANYYFYESSFDTEWGINLAAGSDTIALSFYSNEQDELNGTFDLAESGYSAIKRGSAEAVALTEGSVTIAWVKQDEGGYTYHIEATFSDGANNYSFETEVVIVAAIDDYFYEYCMYGVSEACSLMYINLLDAPKDPLVPGQVAEVTLDNNKVWDYTQMTTTKSFYLVLSNSDEDGNGEDLSLMTKDSMLVGTYADTAAFAAITFYQNNEHIKLQSLEGTITEENGVYSFEFNAGAFYGGTTYHITGTFSRVMDPAYRYDSEADLEKEFTEILVADSTASYGILDIVLSTTDLTTTGTGYEAEIYLYAEAAAEGSIIPAGVYPINSTREFGTVMASTGYVSNYDMPLYVNEYKNQKYADSWYVVSGTVTVTYENNILELTVEGTNYMGASVYLHYMGNAPTGIEEVVVDGVEGVKKQLIDGHMVIVKDGQAFNVLGARVK